MVTEATEHEQSKFNKQAKVYVSRSLTWLYIVCFLLIDYA